MRYVDLAIILGIATFGTLGFFESLSVGNLVYAALSLSSLLFARYYLQVFGQPGPISSGEAESRWESGEGGEDDRANRVG
jgi:hypothetical protein